MTEPKHIHVIGAGIVGVATAIWLQRDGHHVTLIDKAGPGEGTSYGNGGVLASCAVVPVTVPGLVRKAPAMLFDSTKPLFLKWRYLPKLLPWLGKYLKHANAADARRIAKALTPLIGDSLADHQALSAGTDAAKFVVPGDYIYAYPDRAAFLGDAFGWDVRKANGFEWSEIDLGSYDPVFAENLSFGIQLPNHGRITDPGAYVKHLAKHFATNGGRILKGEISGFQRNGGRLTHLKIDGSSLTCDAAVLATGVWSKPLAGKLGLSIPLESERGYHIDLWDPSIMPNAPTMVAAGKFVATPMEGRLRLAGVVEFGGLDAPPSEPPFELLERSARAALPGLTWSRAERWMGHRPAPADSIPVIGEVPGWRGLYMAFGHHHVGLTGGPKTGRLVAQMISGRKPNVDVACYSPARFGGSK
ncbi:NAD(P)/FAD-dependent oxidoreductase [Litoreibacter roseus]|uniref:Dehydrogenase n=1 Tax=Litoreibacter roseus TaxID=2601869 RepID=A0A6N6JAC4_9RHOB|nr:FAD-dependent oxidoreductase [Litoreibacter roseus]GFE62947.1 dehydrogenase [Litoreibacter roseus]